MITVKVEVAATFGEMEALTGTKRLEGLLGLLVKSYFLPGVVATRVNLE